MTNTNEAYTDPTTLDGKRITGVHRLAGEYTGMLIVNTADGMSEMVPSYSERLA